MAAESHWPGLARSDWRAFAHYADSAARCLHTGMSASDKGDEAMNFQSDPVRTMPRDSNNLLLKNWCKIWEQSWERNQCPPALNVLSVPENAC